jgi:hypothetical protein
MLSRFATPAAEGAVDMPPKPITPMTQQEPERSVWTGAVHW